MKSPEYLITVPINPEEMRDLLGSMDATERVELYAWSHRQMNALENMSRIISGVI